MTYMSAIWLLSSTSLSLPVDSFPFRDKGLHFVEYGALGFLVAHAAFRTWPRHHPLRTASLAVLVAVLWGLLDEIHQAFVPGRSSDALDLVADGAGAVVGASLRKLIFFATGRLAPSRGQSP